MPIRCFDPTVLQSPGSSRLETCSVASILIFCFVWFCFFSLLLFSGLFYFALQKFVTSQMALIRTIRQLTFPLAVPDEPDARCEPSEYFEEIVPMGAGDVAGLLTN